ncbi:Metal transporter CNNM2 [Orchesella cincta]|uniref:Metal transporter CNNM2 n=1 Tax=Orchesella cincta TaxID=48709 RepID=A0A1D2NLQ6_ORCCI|nr:Metal transporter CNNM2 [Orchesella cincta]
MSAVDKGVSYEQNGVSTILADNAVPIRLFGQHFTNQTVVRFVRDVKSRGADCDDMDATDAHPVSHIGPNGASAIIEISLSINQSEEFFFICVRENNTERRRKSYNVSWVVDMPWVHQGSDPWITIKVYERMLPLWLNIVFIVFLLLLSGLFAGLTLGLLALDRTDLKILANTGSEKERMYAKTILPLRTQGNYLLCSLVLGNVLINSSLTILLDDLTTGLLAVTFSTIGIVIFGEIIPQAFCSRHGLAIGAKTILITRLIMILTFPLSYVISVILDKVLGEEIGIVYNREKLKELVKITIEHNDLEADEVNIISGALELKKKTVEHIMTRLEDTFMLPLDGELDFETLNEIRKQGYSRIPIYDGERRNIVTILFTKDLMFVDPDDKIPLKTLAQFYNNPCYYVFSDTTLDIVFKEFKECNILKCHCFPTVKFTLKNVSAQKGHMAFVQKINTSCNERDPYCETTGLVTLEDVIEELIQAEIVDETDMWTDNRNKKRTKQHHTKDFSKFVEIRNSQKTIYISPQLALAAFQYLSTGVEPFRTAHISEGVLHRILKKNVLFKIRGTKDLKPCFLYESGKATDSFTLILEGRVEVNVGKEGLQYEAGPFSYFAVPALMLNEDTNFTPDYSVKATGDVVILRIRRPLYQAAVQATIMERSKKDENGKSIPHDSYIEKQIEDVLGKLEPEFSAETAGKILSELESSDDSVSSKAQSTTSTEA